MIRLIATDLDGTLLRSDRATVTARTREALSNARAAGITVVLVSARGPRGVAEIAEAAVNGLAICSNGAIVFDLARGQVLRHRPLASEIAVRMIQAMRERLPDVCFAAETEQWIAFEPAFKGAWDGWEPPADTRYGDAIELVSAPVTKLIARDTTCSIEELTAVAREVAGDDAAASFSGEWVVEIAAAGVNKAAALRELAADLDIGAEEVVAFGDYPNDLPMLAWAGLAIAPANAHADVLAQVDEVTESNDADGVAIAIERLLAG